MGMGKEIREANRISLFEKKPRDKAGN